MDQPVSEWWRGWFGPGYLALYDEYLAERTPVEIDQLEALLALRPPQRILDLPCGQGRHAIELARRGYDVTGADLSPYLLSVAEERGRTCAGRLRAKASTSSSTSSPALATLRTRPTIGRWSVPRRRCLFLGGASS